MKAKQKESLMNYMWFFDDANAPDGAWQAMLEDAAEQWGDDNSITIDGFDAFMDYVVWKQEDDKLFKKS